MSATNQKSRKLLLSSLLVVWMGFVLTLSSNGLAEGDTTSLNVKTDKISEAEKDRALTEKALPIEAVLAYAQEHNPTIRSARSRLLAAQHVSAQVSAYDDPVVTWDNWNTPESLRLDQADNNIFRLSQKIPFPGKLRLKGEIAVKEAKYQEAALQATELDTVAHVKKAYYDLWLASQNLQVYSRDRELMAQFARIAEQKYAVGQVSQPDVLRAQVELTRLVNRMTTATLNLSKTQAQLNVLLSRPPEALLGTPCDPPQPVVAYSLDDLAEQALTQRPELVAQARMVEREELALALAQKADYPDFEVSVSRFANFGRHDGFGLTFSAAIPWVFKGKYEAGVKEAVANLRSAQSNLRRWQDLVLLEVKQALLEAQVALEQTNLFLYTHIPQAEQALASAQIGYQTGTLDFLSLIDSVRTIEQIHLEHFTAAANFENAWAELERAVGKELPRVNTEVKG